MVEPLGTEDRSCRKQRCTFRLISADLEIQVLDALGVSSQAHRETLVSIQEHCYRSMAVVCASVGHNALLTSRAVWSRLQSRRGGRLLFLTFSSFLFR
jgi:hypothetical protein